MKTIYASPARVCHKFSANGILIGRNCVMDDFGNSVEVDSGALLFFVRGPVAALQPEY